MENFKDNLLSLWNKIYSFCNKHAEVFTVLGLAVLFYFIFFHDIGSYSLMDVMKQDMSQWQEICSIQRIL